MTPEKIIQDIYSDRIKKVIIDSDTYNEIDDQYAIAYAVASPKIEILAINAVPFSNIRCDDFEQGMEKSYDEIKRVLDYTVGADRYPVFKGSRSKISDEPEFGPVDSPAARNIVEMANKTDEIIYILAIGAITNVTSALLMDPTIKDKICVVWLGSNTLEYGSTVESNLMQDYAAGQILLNMDIPYVMLPALEYGTHVLTVNYQEMSMIKGDSRAVKFFRDQLPTEFGSVPYADGWLWTLWDIAAPGLLIKPEAFQLSVIPAPVITDGKSYALDRTRHKIIYMNSVDKDILVPDAFGAISTL